MENKQRWVGSRTRSGEPWAAVSACGGSLEHTAR